jgi:hypothetical protein
VRTGPISRLSGGGRGQERQSGEPDQQCTHLRPDGKVRAPRAARRGMPLRIDWRIGRRHRIASRWPNYRSGRCTRARDAGVFRPPLGRAPVARAARPDAGRAAMCELGGPWGPLHGNCLATAQACDRLSALSPCSCRPSRRLRQRDGLVHPVSRPGRGCWRKAPPYKSSTPATWTPFGRTRLPGASRPPPARERGSHAGHTRTLKPGSGPPSTRSSARLPRPTAPERPRSTAHQARQRRSWPAAAARSLTARAAGRTRP